jgi:AcrR family transcriptional regulator
MGSVDSRERLLTATVELLQRDGFSAMSPAAIQRRAGVGQGSMYHHFAGKTELAQVAIERSADRLLAAADQALSGPGSPVRRVAGYLERERDPLLGCPVGRLAQDREVIEDEHLRALVASTFVRLEQRICAALAEDKSLPAPDDLAAAVLATVQGGYVLARAGGDRAPFDRAIAGAIRLLKASTKETADGNRSSAAGSDHDRPG